MLIVNYVDLFIGALINEMFCAIIIKKVFKIKIIKNSFIKYTVLALVSLMVFVINIYNKETFKVLMIIPFVTVGMKYMFNIGIGKSFLYVLTTLIYMFIGEFLIYNILIITKIDINFIFNNLLGNSFGTIIVTLATYPLLYIKQLSKIFNTISQKILNKKIILLPLIVLFTVATLTYRNLHEFDNVINFVINTLLTLILIAAAYFLYKEINKSEQLSQDYNVLLSYLEKYEKEIEDKRKIIHDYKNQLIVINAYADENNKRLKEYIMEIIDEQKKITASSLIKNLDKLPKGLKGLLYYKFSQVNKDLKIDIDVGSNMHGINNLSSKMQNNALKIVGILIDNSIESAMDSKNKYINFELKEKDNKLILLLQNSIKGKINIKSIMDSGFSTKGKGRGYGLSLVNDIIKKNKNIQINIGVVDNLFEARIEIEI